MDLALMTPEEIEDIKATMRETSSLLKKETEQRKLIHLPLRDRITQFKLARWSQQDIGELKTQKMFLGSSKNAAIIRNNEENNDSEN